MFVLFGIQHVVTFLTKTNSDKTYVKSNETDLSIVYIIDITFVPDPNTATTLHGRSATYIQVTAAR